MKPISIHDESICRLDASGRTPAFFCKTKPLAVDTSTIDELVAYARRTGGDVRLCLHEGPHERFHDMIIAQHSGGYHRPHRHMDKGETWSILAGAMQAFVFDDDGGIIDARRLSAEGQFLYRVGDFQFHTLVPLSDIVVYHESKPGPFTGPGDSQFAQWAPDGSDPAATRDYLARLMSFSP